MSDHQQERPARVTASGCITITTSQGSVWPGITVVTKVKIHSLRRKAFARGHGRTERKQKSPRSSGTNRPLQTYQGMNPNGLPPQKLRSLNITLFLIHEPKAKSKTLKVTKDCGDRGWVWNRLCSKKEQLGNQLLNSNYGSQSATGCRLPYHQRH